MLSFVFWYLFIFILGLLAFPLSFRLLSGLKDRGYAFSRTLGWLLWGYLFWLLGSMKILKNDLGGELFVLLILILASGFVLRKTGWEEIREWLRSHKRILIVEEVLFLVAFASWAAVRAANPEIVGTEKPMELAFINAISRSPTLPSHDPWLSGYAISYYHFGYVLVVMLSRITGTPGGVVFNLGVSLVFALSALGVYGIVYNMLSYRQKEKPTPSNSENPPFSSLMTPLLGPFFVLIVSNLEGFFRLLHQAGVFWQRSMTGELVSSFWRWMGLKGLDQPPTAPFSWSLNGHWWWWQASRVVQDFDFNGVNKGDVIDEFPFFSYLLADLHPHVLAMPFAFLAMALALHLLITGSKGHIRWRGFHLDLDFWSFFSATVVLGGLAFLNTWDFPIYVALFSGAYALTRKDLKNKDNQEGLPVSLRPETSPSGFVVIKKFIVIGIALGVIGVLLYLPFYIGFSSQAGGLLPNLIYVTRGVYLWVMFGPLLFPIFVFLVYLVRSKKKGLDIKAGFKLSIWLVLGLLLVAHFLALLITLLPYLQGINPDASLAPSAYLGSVAAPDWESLIREGFIRRLTIPGTLITLVILLTLVLGFLWSNRQRQGSKSEEFDTSSSELLSPVQRYALLLILLGGLLVLGPEFVYLRDLFGYRINTIFKFYFQAWLLWSVVAAYSAAVVWRELRSVGGGIIRFVIIVVLGMSLVYPTFSLWSKTQGFNPSQGWTLDGTAYRLDRSPDEAAASTWLKDRPLGVIAEAVGGSYSQAARISTHSGQPTVLGWDFHEIQWRGGSEEIGPRQGDIARLYCTRDWEEAASILDLYNIRYIVVGNLERTTYNSENTSCVGGLQEMKFANNLEVVFQQGTVTIYQAPVNIH